jgi:hypothetical protein
MRILSSSVLPLLSVVYSARGLTDETNRVICPAIDQDEVARTDYPFDSSMVVSLVAQGSATTTAKENW